MLSWEITASGRVQGVGFRSFAYRCAQQCAIKGYAKNLSDGSVLIIACAEEANFAAFCDLLRSGNRYAQVLQLDIAELKYAVKYDDFEIR